MNVNESILKPLWEKMFPTIPVDSIHGCKGTKWTDNEAQFYSWVDQDRAWKPLGEKMHEYQVKGDQEDAEEESRFEIYKVQLHTVSAVISFTSSAPLGHQNFYLSIGDFKSFYSSSLKVLATLMRMILAGRFI